ALDDLVSGRATAERTRARAATIAADEGGGPRLELVLIALTALVEHDLPRAATGRRGSTRGPLPRPRCPPTAAPSPGPTPSRTVAPGAPARRRRCSPR